MDSISPDTLHVGIFIVVLVFLLQGVSAGANIYAKFFRRVPSIDETLRKDYLPRTEFDRHVSDNAAAIDALNRDIISQRSFTAKSTREVFDQLRVMAAGFNRELQDINKAVGRIEGKLEERK